MQRRTALIQAAADLLLDHGFAAVSHRAVAARAGLPLASTTYYFTSAEDLRDEAVQHVAETCVAQAEAVVDALPANLDDDGAARAVTRIIGADHPVQQVLLMYERYLEAGRHERLRPVVVAWNARLGELVRDVLRRARLPAAEDDARLVLAVADGVAVTALAEGSPPDGAITEALDTVLALLRNAAGSPAQPVAASPD